MGGGAGQSCWLLITLWLKGVLAGDWSVHLPSGPICAVIGSSVALPCSYDYPQSSNETKLSAQGGEVLSEMWCRENSRCITPRYVFHSDGIFPDPSYQNRVEYLGRPGTRNCSLRISDLRQSDSGAYVFYVVTSHLTQKMPEQRGIQLLVADSSSAVAVSASPSSDITEGGAIRLVCCSPAVTSQTSFRWFKSSSSTPTHKGQVWDISDIASDHSGSYYCQIQTREGAKNSTMLHIDVKYPPRNTAVSVSPAEDVQGEFPMTLTCSSDANPPVHTYTWYTGAACFPTADKSFHQSRRTLATPTGRGLTLSSSNITTEEPGLHCCVARNRHGSQMYSVTVTRSRALTPSESSGGRWILIGVTIGVLLAILALVAFFMTRKRKTSRNQSYALTATGEQQYLKDSEKD
ncbi:B-cell receptor CD22-like isoform X1 [Xyrichtys novacula]|uniref:B-cell receptor CD22-like isoform X1 n=1 Tax=Xyrichtys novacula TaxID=13765 RepID=A0AAV1FLU0_XYRNO|nr:B-cell receptor CD22-like isoform X1 [Xyrichtys novacula]